MLYFTHLLSSLSLCLSAFLSSSASTKDIFGRDAFLILVIPAEYYFGFIQTALYISTISALLGAIGFAVIAWNRRPARITIHKKPKMLGMQKKSRNTMSLSDVRSGKRVDRDHDRQRLLRVMMEGHGGSFSNTTITQSAMVAAHAILLLGNFMMWNSLFQTSIGTLNYSPYTKLNYLRPLNRTSLNGHLRMKDLLPHEPGMEIHLS